MSKSIFELSQDFQGILELALDDTMDLDALEEGLKSIEGDMTDKCKNGIGLIRELEARRDAMKAESKRLTANARTLDNKLNRIKQIYIDGLQAFGKSRIDTTIGRMSIQKNPPALKVSVPEGIPYKGTIPDVYLNRIPEHYELDKETIKAALKKAMMYRIAIWKAVSLCASSEVRKMNDVKVSVEIIKLLKESGMEPMDAIICLHGIELSMIKVLRDMMSKDDDESEDDDE